MDSGIILVGIGVVVLVIAVYFKFLKGSSRPVQQIHVPEPVKIDYTYGKINMYFGTAEKFSKILEEEAKENQFQPQLIDLKDYDVSKLNSGELSIFLMATHGEGEPTDNSVSFYKWLSNKETEQGTLSKLRFIVFGLGNSQYEHYNFMGKKTNEHLERLGGNRFYVYGEGDDNASLEDDFNEWKQNLWTELKNKLPKLPLNEHDKNQQKIPAQNGHDQDNQQTVDPFKYIENSQQKYDFQTEKFINAKNAKVFKITEIRQNSKDGSTLHIEIDLKGTGIQYKSAMNLGVYPKNSMQNIKRLSDFCNFDLENVIQIQSSEDQKLPFPQPMSIRNILENFCDITGQVMKSQLKKIAKISTEDKAIQELTLLASPQGKLRFENEIKKQQLNVVDILVKYNIKPNISQFIGLVPRISPRLFTISSSSLKFPDIVHITDSLTYEEIDGQLKYGLCSQYFYDMHQNFQKGQKSEDIRIDFQPSNFVLPQNKSPVLMIGPGTGIAPFIAFCQDKEYLLENGIDKCPGEFSLYFGCRHEDGDYIFKEQLQNYNKNKIINKYYTAFSRDQGSKVYVQHLLEKNSKEVAEHIFEKNGTTFLCGSTSMGTSVKNTLIDIAKIYKNISLQEAAKLVADLENNKFIIKELW